MALSKNGKGAFTKPLSFLYNDIGDNMNILKFVKGDPVSFALYHEVDGKQHDLQENECYRLKIKKNLSADEPDFTGDSDSAQFNFGVNLECGVYYFEIGHVVNATETVISPATDVDGTRLNTLYITERL